MKDPTIFDESGRIRGAVFLERGGGRWGSGSGQWRVAEYAALFFLNVVEERHIILCWFLVVYVALDRVDVFLFSLLLGLSEVVYVFQVASSCFTLFMFVLGRSDGFQIFWRVLERLRSLFRLYFGSSCCQV